MFSLQPVITSVTSSDGEDTVPPSELSNLFLSAFVPFSDEFKRRAAQVLGTSS